MLWKEEYKIGVPKIDEQHRALFDAVEKLLSTLPKGNESFLKLECLTTIKFLKEYTLQHFRDEERYLRSIHYVGYEYHKKQHDDFINTVLEYEKDFRARNYDMGLMKDFIGTLLTWLVYHVEGFDQMIVTGATLPLNDPDIGFDTYFESAITKTYQKLLFGNATKVKENIYRSRVVGDVFSSVRFTGSYEGCVVFAFSQKMAIEILCSMSNMDFENLDEMVISIISKFTGIICNTTAAELTQKDSICSAKRPVVTKGNFDKSVCDFHNGKTIFIKTPIGICEILIKVVKKEV